MSDPLQVLFFIALSIFMLIASFRSTKPFHIPKIPYHIFLSIIMVYILATRLLFLDQLPAGLNQDEAAIGYDAWALAQYGIDRNGYPFPILPMSWGSGAGGFIIYVTSAFFHFLPMTVYTLRLSNALIQLLALFAFFHFLKKFFDKEIALIGLTYFAINPWHFMLSRWNLDANQVFVLMLIGVLLSSIGFKKNQHRYHYLAMVSFAMAMYSYGSGVIVVPILLLLVYGVALIKNSIPFKTVLPLFGFLTFLSIPLIAFYTINSFALPEIITPWFAIPRFNVLRANSVLIPFDASFFGKVWTNLGDTIQYLTTGKSDWLWNQLPSYGIAFLFTFPLLILGLFTQRKQSKSLPFYLWFAVSFGFSLILYQNTNRMGVLFIPMIYFQVHGIHWFMERSKRIWMPVLGIIATATILFHVDYTQSYSQAIKPYFAYGYGEAINYAKTLDKTEYYLPSQNQVNGSHVLALFYIQPNPHDVVETGIYLNPGAEFQYLASFTSEGKSYIFADPSTKTTLHENLVFITKVENFPLFEDDNMETHYFGGFVVLYLI